MTQDRSWPDLPDMAATHPVVSPPSVGQAAEFPAVPLVPDGSPLWRAFDAAWYAHAYADEIDAVGTDVAALRAHYLAHAGDGHSPNRWFDETWYLGRYPDVAGAIASGLVRSGFDHYCRDGFRDRSPHWLFDRATYLNQDSIDETILSAEGYTDLYDHFLRAGAVEGRSAHPLFDATAYRAGLTDEPGASEAIDAMGAWHHFIARIWFDGRDAVTSPYFDPDWFLAAYPTAAAKVANRRGSCALRAYAVADPALRWNPMPQFDEAWYLERYPDAAAAVREGRLLSGYDHFLRFGARERRQPAAHIDLQAYIGSSAAVRVALATGHCRDAFTHLLATGRDDFAAPGPSGTHSGGHIDSHGLLQIAEGRAFIGWIPANILPETAQVPVVARFGGGERRGIATLVHFARSDVAPKGVGALLFLPEARELDGLPEDEPGLDALVELEITCAGTTLIVPANVAAPAQAERAMVAASLASLAAVPAAALAASPDIIRLRVLLGRKPYAGANTLGDLRDRVFLEVDETVHCPALDGEAHDGLVMCGWLLEVPGTIVRLRLHSGGRVREVAMSKALRIDRHDVYESVGSRNGLTELRNGYLAYIGDAVMSDETPYLEVTTARGEIGYRPLPAAKLRGMDAIRFLLDRSELRYGEVAPAFNHVFGPSVLRLNADRLRGVGDSQVIDFGPQPASPELSLIVTLYGRIDFIEYQMAFLSRRAAGAPYELIYVLDDPPRRRQLESLAASAYARFGIPFRIVVLPRNLGFAPANNAGLDLARAPFVCFLNSDVFPGSADWKERLVERLRNTPNLGAVGPLLLFEDGCVQHQGMTFERLPAFANWHFPMHPGKGWQPVQTEGLLRALAITGACVVMARSLAIELGGFDSSFPIGDFEDSDLCLKLHARGLDCAVDTGVRLYHLERQSQAGSQHRWRMNLTLYNAWLHESRWGATLAAEDDIAGNETVASEVHAQ